MGKAPRAFTAAFKLRDPDDAGTCHVGVRGTPGGLLPKSRLMAVRRW